MAKKICRTCLKTTFKTCKVHEYLNYPGESEQLKVSEMLRYLVPELYLGVTVNPEICLNCKSLLRSAYAFRKKCMATENLIGSYLKKSRCNAASIELVDVIVFLEQQNKSKTPEKVNPPHTEVKEQIISEWDDDSRDSENSNETNKQTPQTESKELIFSATLGVFVDKEGNCYNADGMPIGHPETIQNAQTDFLQISEVFSLSEENDIHPKTQKDKPPDESTKPQNESIKPPDENTKPLDNAVIMPRIRVIPEAMDSFKDIPSLDLTQVPPLPVSAERQKTDMIKPPPVNHIVVKKGVKRPRISVLSDTKNKVGRPRISIIQESNADEAMSSKAQLISPIPDAKEPETFYQEPILPIIVDVRSECVEAEPGPIPSIENKDPVSVGVRKEIKEEHSDRDDEDTITASESNSPFDIQGIIDNIPETDDTSYVDVPDFVQINNFTLNDLNELKEKQALVNDKEKKNVETPLKNSLDSPDFVQINNFTMTDLTELKEKQDGAMKDKQNDQTPLKRDLQMEIINKFTLPNVIHTMKPLTPILPKPESSSSLNLAEQLLELTRKNQQKQQQTIDCRPNTKKAQKTCLVPNCPNNSFINPKKLFVWFPRKKERRKEWFEAIGCPPIPQIDLFVCEDHFDLPNDTENWLRFKMVGGRMKMKEDVVPHRYLNERIPEELMHRSQLYDKSNKGKSDQLEPPRQAYQESSQITEPTSHIYSISDESISGDQEPSSHKELEKPSDLLPYRASTQPIIIKRGCKRFKIVQVDPEQVKQIPLKPESNNDSDICVLFTNYTPEGIYVNDHDYLTMPYQRNKILAKEDNGDWMCTCFICGIKHSLEKHVEHMKTHRTICQICRSDLGSPFMLNMHARFHSKKASSMQKVSRSDLPKPDRKYQIEEVEMKKEKAKEQKKKRKVDVYDFVPEPDEEIEPLFSTDLLLRITENQLKRYNESNPESLESDPKDLLYCNEQLNDEYANTSDNSCNKKTELPVGKDLCDYRSKPTDSIEKNSNAAIRKPRSVLKNVKKGPDKCVSAEAEPKHEEVRKDLVETQSLGEKVENISKTITSVHSPKKHRKRKKEWESLLLEDQEELYKLQKSSTMDIKQEEEAKKPRVLRSRVKKENNDESEIREISNDSLEGSV